jgi:hypothetical protein
MKLAVTRLPRKFEDRDLLGKDGGIAISNDNLVLLVPKTPIFYLR